VPEGFLFLGHSDALPLLQHWRVIRMMGTIFYQPPLSTEPAQLTVPESRESCGSLVQSPQGLAPLARVNMPKTGEMQNSKAKARPGRPDANPFSSNARKYGERLSANKRKAPQMRLSQNSAGQPSAIAMEQDRPASAIPLKPLEVISPPAHRKALAHTTAERLALAQRAANEEDFERAQHLLNPNEVNGTTSIEAYLLMALVAEKLNKWELSANALKKALFLDKNLILGHYYLAILNERMGDHKGALRRYRTVCRLLTPMERQTEIPYSNGVTAGRVLELSKARCAELVRLVYGNSTGDT
jgi:tetratricopeptide (TPR) repeat protein